VLPGVREVLQAVADDPRYHSALLTGNIEPAAYLKMELVGLAEFFNLPGASATNLTIVAIFPALAAERITQASATRSCPRTIHCYWRHSQRHSGCARHFGARAFAVGTGRLYSPDDILACTPDALLSDLSSVGCNETLPSYKPSPLTFREHFGIIEKAQENID